MNILLDAYFDLNYGDDIFIETITGMYPAYKFYSFLEYYPQEVCDWAQRIPNLYLLPESNVFLQKNMFDAYICVGGDIFPDQGDYSKRKSYVEAVKQCNGTVAFLGFSLFHEYGENTKKDIGELMAMADIIAPRDEQSADLLRQMLRETAHEKGTEQVHAMADLAFQSRWLSKETFSQGNLLGISVRRPENATEESMENYCHALADVVCQYLQENPSGKVRLFGLSKGAGNDRQVAEAILEEEAVVPVRNRVAYVAYSGDTKEIKEAIRECDAVICTRLHAMISCIAMEIPFLPIVYEVKMNHVLEEVGYAGKVFTFRQLDGLKDEVKRLTDPEKTDSLWDKKREEAYRARTKDILIILETLLRRQDVTYVLKKQDVSGPVSEDKEYAREQAGMVAQKNEELQEMAQNLWNAEQQIKECQELIAQYLQTIEESQRTIAQYLQTIEECNKTNGEYFKTIEELNGNVAKLTEENKYLKEILDMERPYFTGDIGKKGTQMIMAVMARKATAVRENWDEIQRYYSADTKG